MFYIFNPYIIQTHNAVLSPYDLVVLLFLLQRGTAMAFGI